jgi:biopolymer transport protein ExbD
MAGGGSNKPVDGKKKARIEIIPLIDVIFFLLATFVLFTLSLNRIQSVPITLPGVSTAKPQNQDEEDTSVTLQVTESGTLYWNKELIGANEVGPRLQQYKSNEPNPRVLIATDDSAKYGDTIEVLDEVRKANIEQVSIETVFRPTGK